MPDPADTPHDAFAAEHMRLALREARKSEERGDLAVGAVVVLGNEVVAWGGNEAASTGDLLAHAEMQALRDYMGRYPRHLLKSASLYTTFEPCPMCLGACMVLEVGTIVVGGTRLAEDGSWGGYQPWEFAASVAVSGPETHIRKGPLGQECVKLRTESLERAKEQH